MSLAGWNAPVKPASGAALGIRQTRPWHSLGIGRAHAPPDPTTKEPEMNPSAVSATPLSEPATLAAH